MVVLDTNTLILLFSQKNRHQAALVKYLVESKELLCIPDVVLSETEYILDKKYHRTRKEIHKVFQFLIERSNIRLNSYVGQAIQIYRTTSLEMADCLVIAQTKSQSASLATFDKKMLKVSKAKPFFT
ncbi:hypothetical protein A2W24_00105 [Microgenomates group bacterium RBG_16_45_19]|nr:MAG: hypothetical protein A2W24_00105 [Microgenomates group bacterium RBG_16_45_19]